MHPRWRRLLTGEGQLALQVSVSPLTYHGKKCVTGDGFGFPLPAFFPFVCAVFTSATSFCAAPRFFELRPMLVLWCVSVIDSKNKLFCFVQPFFAI